VTQLRHMMGLCLQGALCAILLFNQVRHDLLKQTDGGKGIRLPLVAGFSAGGVLRDLNDASGARRPHEPLVKRQMSTRNTDANADVCPRLRWLSLIENDATFAINHRGDIGGLRRRQLSRGFVFAPRESLTGVRTVATPAAGRWRTDELRTTPEANVFSRASSRRFRFSGEGLIGAPPRAKAIASMRVSLKVAAARFTAIDLQLHVAGDYTDAQRA
jgi:hypothetical protein